MSSGAAYRPFNPPKRHFGYEKRNRDVDEGGNVQRNSANQERHRLNKREPVEVDSVRPLPNPPDDTAAKDDDDVGMRPDEGMEDQENRGDIDEQRPDEERARC